MHAHGTWEVHVARARTYERIVCAVVSIEIDLMKSIIICIEPGTRRVAKMWTILSYCFLVHLIKFRDTFGTSLIPHYYSFNLIISYAL